MKEQINFQFPILTIQEINLLLHKNEKVFACEINALDKNGRLLTLYENQGLDLRRYIGKEMQCLLEITKGTFHYLDEFEKAPDNISVFRYQWDKRLYEYFPELVKIINDVEEADDAEENRIQVLFENTAAKLFKNWGLNGLGIGIYQVKPLLSAPGGFYFLNEYEFEEEIEELGLNEKVYIEIDELYLRGIRPYLPNGQEYKREEQKVAPKQKEPEREEIPKETKKSKFTFLA